MRRIANQSYRCSLSVQVPDAMINLKFSINWERAIFFVNIIPKWKYVSSNTLSSATHSCHNVEKSARKLANCKHYSKSLGPWLCTPVCGMDGTLAHFSYCVSKKSQLSAALLNISLQSFEVYANVFQYSCNILPVQNSMCVWAMSVLYITIIAKLRHSTIDDMFWESILNIVNTLVSFWAE